MLQSLDVRWPPNVGTVAERASVRPGARLLARGLIRPREPRVGTIVTRGNAAGNGRALLDLQNTRNPPAYGGSGGDMCPSNHLAVRNLGPIRKNRAERLPGPARQRLFFNCA